MTLAWAYKKHLGQGLPVSIIIGKLLGKRDKLQEFTLRG